MTANIALLRTKRLREVDRRTELLIKSRGRVRDLGEVYTQRREVDAMLDLIPDMFMDIDKRFLEPACGNGNFLVEILERKVAAIDEATYGGTEHWFEFALLRCLASIYAIDINEDNVREARERMSAIVDAALVFTEHESTPALRTAVDTILTTNIVVGDSLNDGTNIMFIEYTPIEGERFARKSEPLETRVVTNLGLWDVHVTAPSLPTIHYSKLGTA